jgi:N6-adenosine-specific RNA methylase IME4
MIKDYDVHELCKLFPVMNGEQFNALVEDIKTNGLLSPIVLFEGQILDGRHRYKACINLGIEPDIEEFEGEDPLAFVISHNLSRRHLDESQRAMVAGKISNMRTGRPTKSASIEAISKKDAAKKLNVGKASVERAKKVLDKGTPELVQAVEEGNIAVSVAAKIADMSEEQQTKIVADPRPDQAIKKVAREEKEQALAAKTIEQSMIGEKLYGVIYIDPPWKFETFSDNGMDRSADNHYPTMSMQSLSELVMPAAKDCIMFMWATVPMMPEAIDLLTDWGFTYKSHIAWVTDRLGTGYWTRNKHELLLIATKGNVPAPAMGMQPPSVIELPVMKHSEKPEFFADMIKSLYPTTPKVEIFARIGRPGWDVIGNEAPDDEAA